MLSERPEVFVIVVVAIAFGTNFANSYSSRQGLQPCG